MTAFSGGNKSEDSLAISTAILAAQYAVCQPVFLSRTVAASLDPSRVSWDVELMERPIVVDESVSVLGSLLDMNFCAGSAGDGGFVARVFDLRKRGIVSRVEDEMNSIIGLTTRTIGNVVTAPGNTFKQL